MAAEIEVCQPAKAIAKTATRAAVRFLISPTG